MADPHTPPPPQPRVMLGATLLILLQFVSRAITFIANQLLLRYLTAQLLGISTQLEVYYLSVLFFSRESLRVAIQRQASIVPASSPPPPPASDAPSSLPAGTSTKEAGKDSVPKEDTNTSQAAVNLATLTPLLGSIIALTLGALYTRALPAATLATTPYLRPAVHLYALAALLELLSEPAFVLLQLRLQLTARARAEALATLAKCAVTLAVAVHGGGEVGVLPFALGQVAFGGVLLAVYLLYARGEGLRLLPRRLLSRSSSSGEDDDDDDYLWGWFYAPTLKLAATMAAQNGVKYFLTQGDSLLMGVLASAEVQGVYALAANYGSLAARLVFQPVEEASRSYFSRLLAAEGGEVAEKDTTTTTRTTVDLRKKEKNDDDKIAAATKSPPLAEAHASLTRLLHVYTLAALPLLALGPAAAPLLLRLVAGAHWTAAGAGAALAAYVYYIPLLALNGLLEAFVASVASKRALVGQSVWMAGFFAAFAAAAAVLVGRWGWGARGVVLANGVNMVLRIGWAGGFVKGWFAARGVGWSVREVLPGPGAVAAAAVAGQVAVRMGRVVDGVVGVREVLGELVKIAGVAAVLLPALALAERRFLIECYRAVKAG